MLLLLLFQLLLFLLLPLLLMLLVFFFLQRIISRGSLALREIERRAVWCDHGRRPYGDNTDSCLPLAVQAWDVVWVANAIPYFPMQLVTVVWAACAIPCPVQLVTVAWGACVPPRRRQ